MGNRWDPTYYMNAPMGGRKAATADTALRASDEERNAVADRLSRHFAEGRLDQAEFKTRLDQAMGATTRGDLNGLFDDLPRLDVTPVTPPSRRRRRLVPFLLLVAFVFIATGSTISMLGWPWLHVPWVLFLVVGFFIWHRASGHRRYGRRHPAMEA